MSRQRRALVCGACLVLALACAGCTASGGPGQPAVGQTAAGRPVIVIGSFDFPESVILAYLYADALADRGYPVRVLAGLGPRELVDPALMTGLIDLVPEYTGSALEFASVGRVRATALDAVSARLSTAALAGLDAEAELGNLDPRTLARQWLRTTGLAAP